MRERRELSVQPERHEVDHRAIQPAAGRTVDRPKHVVGGSRWRSSSEGPAGGDSPAARVEQHARRCECACRERTDGPALLGVDGDAGSTEDITNMLNQGPSPTRPPARRGQTSPQGRQFDLVDRMVAYDQTQPDRVVPRPERAPGGRSGDCCCAAAGQFGAARRDCAQRRRRRHRAPEASPGPTSGPSTTGPSRTSSTGWRFGPAPGEIELCGRRALAIHRRTASALEAWPKTAMRERGRPTSRRLTMLSRDIGEMRTRNSKNCARVVASLSR